MTDTIFKNIQDHIKQIKKLKKTPQKDPLTLAIKCFTCAHALRTASIEDYQTTYPKEDRSHRDKRILSFYIFAAFYALSAASPPQKTTGVIDDLLEQSLKQINHLIAKNETIFKELSKNNMQLKLWQVIHNTHLKKYMDKNPNLAKLSREMNQHEPFKGLYAKLPTRPGAETKSVWASAWAPTLFTGGVSVALLTSSTVLGLGAATIGLADMVANALPAPSTTPKASF